MSFEDLVAHYRLLASGKANQAQNSMMRPLVKDSQFAEILVFGDEHTLLFIRER